MNNNKTEIRYWQCVTYPKLTRNWELPADAVIIDFGCGNGIYTGALSNAFPQGYIYAVDNDAYMLEEAERNNHTARNIEYVPSLDEVKEKADLVVLYDIIHDLIRDEETFLKVCGYVKQGGTLSIAPFHMDHHDITPIIIKLSGLGYMLVDELHDASVHFGRYADNDEVPFEDYERGNIYNFIKM